MTKENLVEETINSKEFNAFYDSKLGLPVEIQNQAKKNRSLVNISGESLTYKLFAYEGDLYVCVDYADITKIFAAVDESKETLKELSDYLTKNYSVELVSKKASSYVFSIKECNITYQNMENTDFDTEYNRCLELLDKDELDERIEYMRSVNVSDSVIASVLATYENEENCNKPEKKYISGYYNDSDEYLMKLIIEDVVAGESILLQGPLSVGKNVLIETIAWLFNMDLTVFKVNSESCNDDIFGSMSTDNSGIENINVDVAKKFLETLTNILNNESQSEENKNEAAKFLSGFAEASSTRLQFRLQSLGKVLVKGRGVFVLDEMNMGNANFLSSIVNTLADDHSKKFDIPGYGEVELSKKIKVFGTQNPDYVGTCGQNAATKSRLQVYDLKPEISIEKILIQEQPGLDPKVYKCLDSIYSAYSRESNGEYATLDPCCLNIRGFKRALKKIARFNRGILTAIKPAVIDGCPEDNKEILVELAKAEISKFGLKE